jgi:ribosomal protein S18 acetylase RimI-like enzyme
VRWTIRPASLEDSAALALVGSATFLETFAGLLDGRAIVEHVRGAHNEAYYRTALEKGASAWLAELEPGGAPVGYALLAAADLPGMAAGGSDVELRRIYALSRLHGQGVGAALMRSAEEEAARRGALRLLLGVHDDNARALAFYRKCGFQPIAERQFPVGDRSYGDVVLARTL